MTIPENIWRNLRKYNMANTTWELLPDKEEVVGFSFDEALENNLVVQNGAWYSMGAEKLGLGRSAAEKKYYESISDR